MRSLTKIIVLPGLDGTGSMLVDFVKAIGKRYDSTVVAYPADRPLGYHELAELVVQLLPSDGQFVIVAESFSGPVAAIVASARPRGLVGIVFVASFAAKPNRLPKQLGELARFLPTQSGLLRRLMNPFIFGSWTTPALSQAFSNTVTKVSTEVIASRLHQVMNSDFLVEVAAIEVPIRYLRPVPDRLVSATAFARIASVNQRASLVEIDGPHFILQARPESCAELICEFVEELPTENPLLLETRPS